MGILGNFNPFDGSLFKTITNNMQDMYNDYTGVTASKLSAEAANKNTEKQIAWEKQRATSAHQWEVEDLKKAGLNPILSAGGSGAATGSISPQMPDYSQYKGLGALVPLISEMFSNMDKNSSAKKNISEAGLADTRAFTEKTNQILNMHKSGLISEQTTAQALENEINEINKDWLPYEKGVGIAKDVANAAMPFVMGGVGGKLFKGVTTTATKLENNLVKLQKQIKNINKMPGKKTYKLEIKKPKKEWKDPGFTRNRYQLRKDGIYDKTTGEIRNYKL